MPADLWSLGDRGLLVADRDGGPVVDLRDVGTPTTGASLVRELHEPGQLTEVVATQRPGTLLVVSPGMTALALALDALRAVPEVPAVRVSSSHDHGIVTKPAGVLDDGPHLAMRLSGELDDAARCRAVLSAWFPASFDVRTLVLVASELVTNATRHGRGRGVVSLAVDGGVARVGVEDGRSELPHPRGRTGADGGFGLRLVHRLCRAWGVHPTDTGKVVWAEVGVRAGHARDA